MPKISPIQSSFAAGEVSSKVYGRIDSAGYKQGVKKCLNFIPDTRGSVTNRNGFKWKYTVHEDYVGRFGEVNIFNFPTGTARHNNYICVFTKLYLQIKRSLGTILENMIINSEFVGAGAAWEIEKGAKTSVSFEDNTCVLTAKGGESCSICQAYSPLSIKNNIFIYGLLGRHTGEELVFTISSEAFGRGTVYYTKECTNMLPVFQILNKTLPAHVVGTLWFATLTQKSVKAEVSSVIDKVYMGMYDTTLESANFGTLFDGKDISKLQFQMDPEGLNAVITGGGEVPTRIVYDREHDTFSYGAAPFEYTDVHGPAAAGTPPEWTTSPPTTMDFFGGRAWYGGCEDYPDVIWASASGAYYLLGDGTGTLATDPMRFTTTKYGRIKWIRASKDLLIGTDTHEFKLWSGNNSDSLIHPGQYLIEQQTSYGSVGFKPIEVGRESVFISPDRTKLRTLEYNWQASGYVSQDLSYVSDEVTSGKIKDLAVMHHPQKIILAVLEDGTLIMCNYHREGAESSPLMGWSKHSVYEGVIQTVCAVETEDFTEIFIGVRRVVEGKFVITVESLAVVSPSHDIEVHPRQFAFVDTYSVRMGEAFVHDVSNLNHLNGKWVTPVVDYAVQKPVQVINGTATLEYPGRFIIIGVPYDSVLETLPYAQEKEGISSLGYMKRWVKSYLYLNASVKPLINGQRPPERHPATSMGLREPSRTEIIEVTNLGRERLQTVEVINDKPLPVTILGLFGEMGQESL